MTIKKYRGPHRTVVAHRETGHILLECGHILYRNSTHDERRLCKFCPRNVNHHRATEEEIRKFKGGVGITGTQIAAFANA